MGTVPKPEGLTATAGATSIFLEWEPSEAFYVTGYNVYRDFTLDGSYSSQLNGAPLTEAAHEDASVNPAITYYYRVTAVTDDPYESEKSDPAWATAGEIVVTMPDIRAEASESVRLPINIDAAWGINGSGTLVEVTYDKTLLTPTAVEKTPLTQDFTLADNVDIADGQVNVAILGAGTLVGEGHFLDILFDVAPGAQVDTTSSFVMVTVEMFDWNLLPLGVDFSDTALFTVSPYYFLGDVTGDGVLDMADAILAQQIADGEVEPTALELLAADINGEDRGWYPAENVQGWLIADSYLHVEVDGTTYFGFLVRHAGIAQLGVSIAQEEGER